MEVFTWPAGKMMNWPFPQQTFWLSNTGGTNNTVAAQLKPGQSHHGSASFCCDAAFTFYIYFTGKHVSSTLPQHNTVCVKVLQKILQRQENDWSRTDLQQGFRTEWAIRVLSDSSQFGTNRLIEFYVAETLMDDWEYRLLSAFHQDVVVCSFYTSKPELRLSFTSVCDYVFIMQDLQTKPDGLGNIFTLVEGLKKSGSKPFFLLVSKSWVVIQRTHSGWDPSIKPNLR